MIIPTKHSHQQIWYEALTFTKHETTGQYGLTIWLWLSGSLPAVTLTFYLLTPKANQHSHEPKYIWDQDRVKFPSLVFQIWHSQGFPFDLLTPKSNQHIYEPKGICDQNWVKFPPSFIGFLEWHSQGFWRCKDSCTHALTHRQTDPNTACLWHHFSTEQHVWSHLPLETLRVELCWCLRILPLCGISLDGVKASSDMDNNSIVKQNITNMK